MYTLTVIDSDRWIAKGIESYFQGGCIKVRSINGEQFDKASSIAAGSDAIISEIHGFGHDPQAFTELFQNLRQLSPPPRLILLTDLKEQAVINYIALKIPGAVIFSKRSELTKLTRGIFETLLQNPSREYRTISMRNTCKLTHREFTLLRQLATKKSLTEIGSSFSLSSKTISFYKRSIMRKLKCKNCMELHMRLAKMGFGS